MLRACLVRTDPRFSTDAFEVRSGSNSAVSGFLRHGCFTPETGHCSAWLARQKSANSGLIRCGKRSARVAVALRARGSHGPPRDGTTCEAEAPIAISAPPASDSRPSATSPAAEGRAAPGFPRYHASHRNGVATGLGGRARAAALRNNEPFSLRARQHGAETRAP